MRGHQLLYGASALMVLGFIIHLAVDYYQYYRSFYSAPFYIWLFVDALLWLIPALIAVIAGYVAKKKMIKKENRK